MPHPVHSFVPAILALSLVFPAGAHAQTCDVAWLREELTAAAWATSGPPCVEIFMTSREVCSPAGQKIENTDIDILESKNGMPAHSKAEILAGETCAKFTIGVRTLDHVGNHPNYLCSPGFLRTSVSVAYCK